MRTTKQDLVEYIFERSRYNKKDIQAVVELFLEGVKSNLSNGNEIELRGFGTFEIKKRKGRENARNPKTGESVGKVEGHCVASFKAGAELGAAMRQLIVNS